MLGGWDAEDLVQLFQGKRLGLRQAKVREREAEQVPSCIPAESASRSKSSNKRWPGKSENEVETPTSGGSKRHSNVTNVQWLYDVSINTLPIPRLAKLTNASAEYVKGTGPSPGE